jgi:hypothetical protein
MILLRCPAGKRILSIIQIIQKNVHTGSGNHPASCVMSNGVHSSGVSGRSVNLTTHIYLVFKLRISGTIPICRHGGGREKRYYFHLQNCPHRFWGPTALLFKRYRGVLSRGQSGQGVSRLWVGRPCKVAGISDMAKFWKSPKPPDRLEGLHKLLFNM